MAGSSPGLLGIVDDMERQAALRERDFTSKGDEDSGNEVRGRRGARRQAPIVANTNNLRMEDGN